VAIYRDVYLHRDVELTALLRARAAWLATGATLAGVSAAAVHGTKWLDGSAPAEVVRSDRHAAAGLVVHSWTLGADDVCVVGGVDVTTAARTAFDIGRTRAAAQAIPERIALLEAAGWVVVRVSADMLSRPELVVSRVRDKLRARGCPV
jgi:hypothetical protein